MQPHDIIRPSMPVVPPSPSEESPPTTPSFDFVAEPPSVAPPTKPPMGDDDLVARFKAFLSTHKASLIIGTLAALLVINLGISAWLFHKVDQPNVLSVKTTGSSGGLSGDNTLYINAKTKSVGVGTAKPEGLQVGSDITQTARGSANVRLGLLKGQPVVMFEDGSQQQWQLGLSNSSLQIGQPGSSYFSVDKNGSTSLGKDGSSTLTVQAANLAAPNNLNIGNNALFVDSAHGSVAIGAASASGNKLLVAGNFKANGSIQSGGQVIGVAGSAAQPSITFSGDTNTGIYSAGSNIVSITSSGTETLRVQPGNVSTLNGAELSVSGFLQSGSNSPAWQVARFTGRLDGAGTGVVGHGISNASARVILAMAWYESSGGVAKPLSVDFIDGSNFQVTGGTGNAAWRGVIMYTSDAAGW